MTEIERLAAVNSIKPLKARLMLAPSRSERRSSILTVAALLVMSAGIVTQVDAQQTAQASTALEDGFRDPPASARPRVWWHWMNGNITEAGIRKDLEWMHRIGIGGAQTFDANQATPQIVDKRLVYMTPAWKQAFRSAAALSDRLGLELAIASSPGWSETGGPWVRPEDGMKKLVWSETSVAGGKRFAGRLAAPPVTTGAFQDLPAQESADLVTGKNPLPVLYRDVAVLAYRIADAKPPPMPRFTATDGTILDASALTDGSFVTAAHIKRGTTSKPATVTLDYDTPQTIRSASLFVPGAVATPLSPGLRPMLEASDNGTAWRKVADVIITSAPSTVSFPAVTARHFRFVFASASSVGSPAGFSLPAGVDMSAVSGIMGRGPGDLSIAELRLSGEAKVNQFEAKAGFATTPDYYALDDSVGPDMAGIPGRDIVDLTARARADGTLDWTPPKGKWRVVRIGWSLVGKVNHPATEEATGLEVDKMDAAAVRRYLEHYIGMYRDAAGIDLVGAHGVRAFVDDSTEVGPFNWTPAMVGEFKRLRGYDPTPWLPALTGAIIGSRSQSDGFLYDFRRTIADLHASAHYGTITQIAHDNGLRTYGEALETGRSTLGDDMTMRSHADYPMAAMWYIPRGYPPRTAFLADMKGASSVAHLYGQNIAAAESMTSILSPWATGPAELRQTIDLEFAYGINRPVIHTSVHQPVDDKVPGLSLGVFGQYFNRHETWAEMAGPWIDYISRNAYMLQQGRNAADVGYFYGEEAPLSSLYNNAAVADAPTRYAYDFVSADALLNLLSVDAHDLVAPSGARYRILYLGGSSRKMTLPVLRRIASLAEGGATIVGTAPEGSPSLMDDKPEYAALVKRLWPGTPVTGVGKGRVIAGRDAEAALASIGARPDFTYASPAADSSILFVHRKLDDGDAYFVDNRKDRAEMVEARFRVAGRIPEIWHADTGVAEAVSYRIDGPETVVPLSLGPEDSFFVVFRKPATATSATIARPRFVVAATLEGSWEVAFQPGRGAPAETRVAALGSLSDQADPGIRYFSGVASYTKQFSLPRGAHPGAPLMLDLGRVGDIAEVRVNGRLVGTVWHAPYALDIGPAVKPGANRLEVRVADLWVNRLIGDMQPGARRVTYTSIPTFKANAPLRPSGLIGPVTLGRPIG